MSDVTLKRLGTKQLQVHAQSLQALDWISSILDEKFPSDDLGKVCQDGVILCKLLQKLDPSFTKNPVATKVQFKQMQNVQWFIEGCKKYGTNPLFACADIPKMQNLERLTGTLHVLSRDSRKKGFKKSIEDSTEVASFGNKSFDFDENSSTSIKPIQETSLEYLKEEVSLRKSGKTKSSFRRPNSLPIRSKTAPNPVDIKLLASLLDENEDDLISKKIAELKESPPLRDDDISESPSISSSKSDNITTKSDNITIKSDNTPKTNITTKSDTTKSDNITTKSDTTKSDNNTTSDKNIRKSTFTDSFYKKEKKEKKEKKKEKTEKRSSKRFDVPFDFEALQKKIQELEKTIQNLKEQNEQTIEENKRLKQEKDKAQQDKEDYDKKEKQTKERLELLEQQNKFLLEEKVTKREKREKKEKKEKRRERRFSQQSDVPLRDPEEILPTLVRHLSVGAEKDQNTFLTRNLSLSENEKQTKIEHEKQTKIEHEKQTKIEHEKQTKIERTHTFKSATFMSPTYCDYCTQFLWGVYKQGKECKTCKMPVHDRCAELVKISCDNFSSKKNKTISSVENAPIGPPPKPEHFLENRGSTIWELLVTEETYVKDLTLAIDLWLKPLQNTNILPPESMTFIFGDLEKLLETNTKILNQILEETSSGNSDQWKFGPIFSQMAEDLKIYDVYVNNFDLANLELKKIQATHVGLQTYLGCVIEENKKVLRNLDLEDFLIKPVQRILKYPLFAREMLKATPEKLIDYELLKQSIEKLDELGKYINDMKTEISPKSSRPSSVGRSGSFSKLSDKKRLSLTSNSSSVSESSRQRSWSKKTGLIHSYKENKEKKEEKDKEFQDNASQNSEDSSRRRSWTKSNSTTLKDLEDKYNSIPEAVEKTPEIPSKQRNWKKKSSTSSNIIGNTNSQSPDSVRSWKSNTSTTSQGMKKLIEEKYKKIPIEELERSVLEEKFKKKKDKLSIEKEKNRKLELELEKFRKKKKFF